MADKPPPENEASASTSESVVADIFNNAKLVSLEFEKYKYDSDVAEMRLGKFIILKIRKPDQGLVDIPADFGSFKLRVFADNGKVITYPVKMIQRKLPFMVMSFPTATEAGFARSTKRLFVKQTVLIVRRKKDNVMVEANSRGMGILTDLSPGGCAVISKMELQKGDKVIVYLNVSETKEPESLEMTTVVRRALEEEDGYGEFGMEWLNVSEDKLKRVKEYLVKHPAASVALK